MPANALQNGDFKPCSHAFPCPCQLPAFGAFYARMKNLPRRPWPVWIGLLILGLASGVAGRAQAPLSADDIVQRAVQRAESPAAREARPPYRYTKHTVTDELDARGRLKDRHEKLYEVRVESGLSRLKLVQINGQSLSAEEQKKQDAQDLAARQKMTDARPGKKGDERENFLTAELVAKYKFKLIRELPLNGRDTYELAFEPASANLPANHLTDRFLNQLAGTVWIDTQEFEIARAEVHLQGEVALWGGMIGTLTQCNYTLERVRQPDGAWFNGLSRGFFEGRKLLEPMLIRTRSESTGFQRLDLAFK
jgi:hypothetical protein